MQFYECETWKCFLSAALLCGASPGLTWAPGSPGPPAHLGPRLTWAHLAHLGSQLTWAPGSPGPPPHLGPRLTWAFRGQHRPDCTSTVQTSHHVFRSGDERWENHTACFWAAVSQRGVQVNHCWYKMNHLNETSEPAEPGDAPETVCSAAVCRTRANINNSIFR